MSTNRGTLEAEDNPEQYEELFEDWFSDADYDSSSFSIPAASLGFLVIKRQTYPHWEKDLLKDEVSVRLHGKGGVLNVANTSSVDRPRTDQATASQSQGHSRLAAPDIAFVNPPTSDEPNNIQHHDWAQANDNDVRSHHNVPSPSHLSHLITSIPPYLRPATQFPPLDRRAQVWLRSEAKLQIPTFSFSRLQTMVADSISRSFVSDSSILCHLVGLHNQIQGSPQHPFLWRLPLEVSQDVVGESSGSSSGADEVDSLSSAAKAIGKNDGLPKLKAETLTGSRSVGHPSVNSFHPDYSSSIFSGSSNDVKVQGHRKRASSAFVSGSECTCGHKKHYVRPLQRSSDHDDAATDLGTEGDDEREDFSFYFRSAGCSRHGSSNRENNSNPSDHARDPFRRSIFADTASAIENFNGSERSIRTRATVDANASRVSLYPLPSHSRPRTSSESYLSPNFPDLHHDNTEVHFAASTIAFPTVVNDRKDTELGDERRENDNHRVYFAEPDQPSSPSTLRKFFAATRRRVSSFGVAARRPNYRSTLSAKEELEKTEHRRPWKDTKRKQHQRHVLVKRGRSSTVKGLEVNPALSREASPVRTIRAEYRQFQREPERPVLSKENSRRSRKPSFMRRFFKHLGTDDKGSKAAEQSHDSTRRPSSVQPELGVAVEDHANSTSVQAEKEKGPRTPHTPNETNTRAHSNPRARTRSGAVLFRHFSLTIPRASGSGRRKSLFGRE